MSLVKKFMTVGGATMASRLLGFSREAMMAAVLGAGPVADAFYAAIREYWPELPDDALQPAYAGIRPKLSGPGEPAADFVIQGPAAHGVRGLVNLFGIESPGLTASLAIAQRVCEIAGRA